ncbi:MAG: hypothetical protein HY880_05385 [Deltaproteobacteria bacterium]|nr:hypothetical protein [Deltaproteobacteria bacterium]
MSFWEKVNKEITTAVEEGWSALKDGARIATERSETLTRTGKLRYRTYTMHRKAEKNLIELGGLVYDMATRPGENPLANPCVIKVIERIKKLEQDIAVIETEIKGLKKKP